MAVDGIELRGVRALKLLKEPMLHFVIAGGLLFAADALLNRHQAAEAVEPIRIGQGEVRWLQESFANQWQRPPSRDELRGLVRSLLEEELLAREAQALELDQGDTVVRRRLAQKLEFLIEDTSQIEAPTEVELRQFYTANIDRFRSEPRVSLNQIFFSTERRRHAVADARAALVSISATEGAADPAALGDPLLLETSLRDVDRQALSNMFGEAFAAAVFDLPSGTWSGPVESSFGLHLVEVTDVQAAAAQPFEAVRAEVEREWRIQSERDLKAAYLAKLREKYGVVVADGVQPMVAADAGGSITK
jgi:hypothetical protein